MNYKKLLKPGNLLLTTLLLSASGLAYGQSSAAQQAENQPCRQTISVYTTSPEGQKAQKRLQPLISSGIDDNAKPPHGLGSKKAKPVRTELVSTHAEEEEYIPGKKLQKLRKPKGKRPKSYDIDLQDIRNNAALYSTVEGARRKLREVGISNYDEAMLEAYDEPDLLRLFITAGADINAVNKDGETVLHKAIEKGYAKSVELLLMVPGIDINKVNHNNWSPLYLAAVYGFEDCVKLLLEAPGIDVSAWNPLSIAVLQNDRNKVKTLLQYGSSVNKADKYGHTPLDWATYYGRAECLKLLIAVPGIEINKADKHGNLPLCHAARDGHTECVRLLLGVHGIDVNKANKDGKTPLRIATEKGLTECAELLRAAGGHE